MDLSSIAKHNEARKSIIASNFNNNLEKGISIEAFNTVVTELFQLQAELEHCHRQTKNEPKHEALGEAYTSLSDLKDTIIEHIIGATGERYDSIKLQPIDQFSNEFCIELASRIMVLGEMLEKLASLSKILSVENLAQEVYGIGAQLSYKLSLDEDAHENISDDEITKGLVCDLQKGLIDEDTYIDSMDLIKGGKKAFIGEKRMFGGREYIKTATGWKFHGKGTGSKAQEHVAGTKKEESQPEPKKDSMKLTKESAKESIGNDIKNLPLNRKIEELNKVINGEYRGYNTSQHKEAAKELLEELKPKKEESKKGGKKEESIKDKELFDKFDRLHESSLEYEHYLHTQLNKPESVDAINKVLKSRGLKINQDGKAVPIPIKSSISEKKLKEGVLSRFGLSQQNVAQKHSHEYNYKPEFKMREDGTPYIQFSTGSTVMRDGGSWTKYLGGVHKERDGRYTTFFSISKHKNNHEADTISSSFPIDYEKSNTLKEANDKLFKYLGIK